MFKRSKGRHARKRGAWAAWVGPLFAFEALLVTLSAKHEMDAAVSAQLAEYARGGAL
jgi:hypothetical protein